MKHLNSLLACSNLPTTLYVRATAGEHWLLVSDLRQAAALGKRWNTAAASYACYVQNGTLSFSVERMQSIWLPSKLPGAQTGFGSAGTRHTWNCSRLSDSCCRSRRAAIEQRVTEGLAAIAGLVHRKFSLLPGQNGEPSNDTGGRAPVGIQNLLKATVRGLRWTARRPRLHSGWRRTVRRRRFSVEQRLAIQWDLAAFGVTATAGLQAPERIGQVASPARLPLACGASGLRLILLGLQGGCGDTSGGPLSIWARGVSRYCGGCIY